MSEHEQKSFTFWVGYFDAAKRMNAKNRLAFYDAIMDYIFLGIDREKELEGDKRTSQAFFAFLGNKAQLKVSKIRAEAGKTIKPESNDNQNEIKRNQNAPKVKDKVKDKVNKEQTAPHSCPKCGGLLDKTGIHRQRGNGDEYMHVCPKCGTEVWA